MIVLVPLVRLAAAPAAAAPTPTAGQQSYAALAPQRVMDTRSGLGVATGPVGPGGTVDLTVTGGSVPADATAVVLNVTAVGASEPTDIRVFPTPASGQAYPTVSNLNVLGPTVADLVVVKIGANGQVRFRNNAGSVHLVADLAGFYGPSATGSYAPRDPVRLLDTRTTGTRAGPGGTITLDLSHDASGAPTGLPANATAVTLTITAVDPTAPTDVRVYPTTADGSVPVVSNLNPYAGQTVANLAVVAVGTGGTVTLRNNAGSVHLLADLSGWYVPDSSASVFHPLDPRRLLDTRAGSRLGPQGVLSLTVAGAGAVPASATAVALTVTGVQPSADTDLRVYPSTGGSPPVVSNINLAAGEYAVPNAVHVAVGRGGQVQVFNDAGSVDVVVDLAGWYGPAGDGWDISWPQCTNPYRTGTTSSHPPTGAFAMIGLTNGRPYTDNACLADEWSWAGSLAGGAAGYVVLDDPGAGDSNWGTHPTPQACDGTTSAGCAYDYGWWAADHAMADVHALNLPADPQVWLDVEGPYSSGPIWQSTASLNAADVQGAIDRLRSAGVRTGVYSRQSDWSTLTGGLSVPDLQQWVFPGSGASGAASLCASAPSFSPGSVVLAQYQTSVNGTTYDADHTC